MTDIEYLQNKRIDVLKAIKPICEAFSITDYDYVVKESGQTEALVIKGTVIGCSSNSISAIIDELIGYLFIKIWCKNRCLGCFSTQVKNQIKAYWKES